jgi:hypothetical protein
MSILLSYFSAKTDELAAATLDWPSGPEGGPKKRAFRKQESGFDGIDGWGVEPVVQLGMLEALLTGKTFEQQFDDPFSRPTVAERAAGGSFTLVIRINDEFVAALASSEPQRLADLASPWSEIEEFGGRASIDDLKDFLLLLRDLAKRSRDRGELLYCWLAV